MSSIEALKKQARSHEQKEEWSKALDQYKRAIAQLAQEEQPDIGLYNRVADIQVRQGQIAEAVANYEQAIALYVEADLPNNAIAVCKKIVRNMPMRHPVYLRMGQIRGKQGLVADARQNFLTYAERMQAEGNIDEGLRALVELADLAPEDSEIRLAVAAQMQGHGRTDEAVTQLQAGYRLANSKGLDTDPFEEMLRELGAEPDLTPPAPLSDDDGLIAEFGEIMIGADADDGEGQDEVEAGEVEAAEVEAEGVEAGEVEIAMSALEEPLPSFDTASDVDEEGEPLPMLDDEDVGEALPMFEVGEEPAGTQLDAPAFGESDRGEDEASEYVAGATELPELEIPVSLDPLGTSQSDPMGHEALAAMGDIPGAMTSLRTVIKASPDDVALQQRLIEYAFRLNDESALVPVLLELAETLERTGHATKARPVYQQVLSVDPQNARALEGLGQSPKAAAAPKDGVASSDDYVDLGSLLMGDDQEEKTTRFVVAYEEPSGDEQADFAKVLSQFKAKVSENLDSDDVKSHQDLGTAYKGMGLIDEAIEEFQLALRASSDHLPTYELLGQCFIEKGEPEAAVRTLTRALDAPWEIEDELMGIYYSLGRAHELLGNKPQALEFYDRVFSLDINFADVTERLRALR